jgi:hypothetical protein
MVFTYLQTLKDIIEEAAFSQQILLILAQKYNKLYFLLRVEGGLHELLGTNEGNC